MERERFIEMTENLKRLTEMGVLQTNGAPIFLFAHCEATIELADELLRTGIKPSAILDNNLDKYGLIYKGIPVCEPQIAVKNENSGDAVLLIVSRFYEQMASQMRKLGFTGRILKLADYNTYAEYSLSPDTLIRKSERLNRGIERLSRIKEENPGRLIILCPFPALGDVYFCMSYLKSFFAMNGYDKSYHGCLVCVVGNAQRQAVGLFDFGGFPDLDVKELDQNEIDEATQAVIYTNDPDCYIAHQDRPYVVDLHRALYKKCIPLETVYKCGVFGLPQDTKPERPTNWMDFNYSVGGKKVIISPFAKSVASLPERLWTDMVDDLKALGYDLYTNVCGDEKALPGTKPISPTIAEMKSAVEQAGLFIGIRSGMCDVIKTADCRKIALYSDYYYCDTKWKSIDMYLIAGFENIVVKDGDTWEEVKKQIRL